MRSQECRDRLPKLLRRALCLTVFESKGLEFDDVFLYNFFTDSSCTLWKRISTTLRQVEKKPTQSDNQSGVVLVEFEEERNGGVVLPPDGDGKHEESSQSHELGTVKQDRGRLPITQDLLCSELKVGDKHHETQLTHAPFAASSTCTPLSHVQGNGCSSSTSKARIGNQCSNIGCNVG